MTENHLKAMLDRVANWPKERQEQLAELVREIEAEMSNLPYQASLDELKAIDEGMAGDVASEQEINTAYDTFSPP